MEGDERERVERLYEALSGGVAADVNTLCRHDVEIELGMASPDWHPGSYSGHAGVREFFAEIKAAWDEVIVTPREVRVVDGALLVRGRIFARGRVRGMRDIPAVWIWESRDGLFTSGRVFHSESEALSRLATRADVPISEPDGTQT